MKITQLYFLLNGEINIYCPSPETQMHLQLLGLKWFSPMDNTYVYNKIEQKYNSVFIKKIVAN